MKHLTTVPEKKIFTLTTNETILLLTSFIAVNQYFVISPFELMTIWSLLGIESAREAK